MPSGSGPNRPDPEGTSIGKSPCRRVYVDGGWDATRRDHRGGQQLREPHDDGQEAAAAAGAVRFPQSRRRASPVARKSCPRCCPRTPHLSNCPDGRPVAGRPEAATSVAAGTRPHATGGGATGAAPPGGVRAGRGGRRGAVRHGAGAHPRGAPRPRRSHRAAPRAGRWHAVRPSGRDRAARGDPRSALADGDVGQRSDGLCRR